MARIKSYCKSKFASALFTVSFLRQVLKIAGVFEAFYLFELLFTQLVLPLLGLQEATELFLLLHVDVLLELLFIIGKHLQLNET